MSLSTSLTAALSGLQATQTSLSVVAGNVANANTPGYVRQQAILVSTGSGSAGSRVQVTGVDRQLDRYIQSQLWTETAGGAYADQVSNILGQLQSVYGTPGGAGTLETALSNFTSALQGLSSSAGSAGAQTAAVDAAQSLALQLNATTRGIQSLRTGLEQDLSSSVQQANQDLAQIAKLNGQLEGLSPTDPAALTLMDQRDGAISDLAKLMNIRVTTGGNNQALVYTTTGVQLAGLTAVQLSFNGQGNLDATDQWSSDPTKSGVGTIRAVYGNGSTVDLVANKAFTSGQIGADLTLRDQALVQAQAQVDQLAATLASAASDQTTAGTAVTAGTQKGFDLDLTNVLAGNTVNLTYTDTATNTQHQVTIVRVDDPAALPLPASPANPNNPVIGVNFTGGMASIISQLNSALGGSLQFSTTGGQTLRVLNNTVSAVTVNAASVTATTTSLTSGNPQLPLFTDGPRLYTGQIFASGSQMTGFAGRITVNAGVVSDPTRMSVYSTSPLTNAGDTTRPDFLYDQLTAGIFSYAPQTGVGSAASPFSSTITSYLQQVLGMQGNAATAATQLQQGQAVLVNTLQHKFNTTAGVNMDNEMGNLISLQNAYGANARVLSVVQSMMTTLLQILP